ncbi:hypothetical protein CRG98_026598 [Punica granatum]|uniref:ADP-ribosyl cyclase/cyclic ADP-ribose hydrolase n=1 Tax=Punica granatum TaxID=22663 RepID=A0A2I0J9V5_PUNGR|nr:hypothetical protein CRG98_026598 [Punica granatum]
MEVGSKNNLLYFFKSDVFLCFHREDTREGFTGYLRDALLKKHLKTSKDVQRSKDRPISEPIEEILKSRLSVVIFSENFASSESCLEELAMILECREALGLEVLPIFYKVKISELRHQVVGKTAEHLAAHDERHGGNSDKVARWRNAVKDLGGLSGYTRRPGYVSRRLVYIN